MFNPGTIYSDDEVEGEVVSDNEEQPVVKNSKKNGKKKVSSEKKVAPKFNLVFEEDSYAFPRKTIKEIISEDEESDNDNENEDAIPDNIRSMPIAEERAKRAQDKMSKKQQSSDEVETAYEMDEETENAFFDTVVDGNCNDEGLNQFTQLNLSRPLLRGVEAAGYVNPTPIQSKVIPLALAGRDICASAMTGSGKTAAFLLPVLQRLLYRPRDHPAIRVLIVTPTRELATQIHEVFLKLASYTDISCALILGGSRDVRAQEVILRQRPDLIVCTPGRMIDHLRNSPSITIDELDVLILDEVDRLLELGFQEEVEQLVKFCPEKRQTLLFSATMTARVDDLARLSLRKPIRVKTSGGVTSVAPRLIQEFVKLKDDGDREAILAALVVRNFHDRAIVFFETKKDAHRFYLLLKFLDVAAVELHGNLSQTLRSLALDKYRRREADVLVCTDVAARGLDLPGVQTVLNAEMPRQASTYVHRVGRTARAGCGGRAVTIVSDGRRKILKEIMKGEEHFTQSQSGDKKSSTPAAAAVVSSSNRGMMLSRSVPASVIDSFREQIEALETSIAKAMEEEIVLRKLEEGENEATRAENLLKYADEIHARPARTWYQTESEKQALKEASRAKAKEESELARFGSQTRPADEGSQSHKPSESKSSSTAVSRDDSSILAKQARQDRFELDAKDAKKLLNHQHLSRKKRRRLEAMQDDDGDDEGGQAAENDESNSEHGKKEPSVKQIAKRVKVAKRENQKSAESLSVSQISSRKDSKLEKKLAPGEKVKIRRPIVATGGLDADLRDWGMLKSSDAVGRKQSNMLKSELESITKMGEKAGSIKKHHSKANHHSFKSNKRYKRR